MKKNLTNEILLLAVTIVVSVLVWFAIIYTKNPSIEISVKNVPVSFLHEAELAEKGLCVLRPQKPQTATATLSGKRGDLFHVIDRIKANANLSEINFPGTASVNIDFSCPLSTVEIVKKTSSSIEIKVEETAAKEIPAVIKHIGSNKTYLVESSVKPESIFITGAKSEVELVDAAYIYVDINQLSSNKKETVGYVFVDASGDALNELVNISADTDTVEASNTLYRKKVTNIDVEYPDSVTDIYDVETLSVSPSECVAGISGNMYDAIKSITVAAPENLAAGQNQKFTVCADSSDDAYLDEQIEITVAANIEEKRLIQKTIPIDFQGAPKEKIDPSASSITLSLFTTEKRLENAQISASVNLSDYSPGEYKDVPVSITVPKQVSVSGVYTVDVIIR